MFDQRIRDAIERRSAEYHAAVALGMREPAGRYDLYWCDECANAHGMSPSDFFEPIIEGIHTAGDPAMCPRCRTWATRPMLSNVKKETLR